MKKTAKIILVSLLALTVAVPVFGWGPDGGKGGMMGSYYNHNTAHPGQFMRGNMMGGFSRNQGSNNQYPNLTEDQVSRLNDLQKKYYDETAELRNQMRTKSNELNTALNSADPDADKVKALQAELNGLRTQMSDARIDYDLEAKKISPDSWMRGPGRMSGMGSFAQGVCF